jgi:hypothetical protein
MQTVSKSRARSLIYDDRIFRDTPTDQWLFLDGSLYFDFRSTPSSDQSSEAAINEEKFNELQILYYKLGIYNEQGLTQCNSG